MPVDMSRAARVPRKVRSEIQRVEIEEATNGGYVVRCFLRQPEPKGGKGDAPVAMPYREPELKAFEDFKGLQTFLKELWGGGGNPGGGGEKTY